MPPLKHCLLYVVLLSLPIGVIAQPFAGDFRSFQSGTWNNTSTWERFDGASWINPAPFTPTDATAGIITIRSGHAVTVSANVATDQTSVQAGATLSVSVGMVLTIADGAGIDLSNSGSVSTSTETQLSFAGGASYDHAQNGGVVPLATWAALSTCKISGATNAAPTNLNPAGGFQNFTWNATAQAVDINLNGTLRNVQGNLRVRNSNNHFLQLVNTAIAGPITIGGDFEITGDSSKIIMNSAFAGLVVNVAGNFNYFSKSFSGLYGSILTGNGSYDLNVSGDFNMNAPGGNVNLTIGTATANFNLSGNFSLVAGTLTRGNGAGRVNFVKNGTQNFSNTGTITGIVDFVVSSSSTLNMLGESAVAGSGTFTLNGKVQLGSLNSAGALIANPAVTGNIRSYSRIFNAGSTVVYAGLGPQFIGSGHPTTVGVITEIKNASGVTFNATTSGNSSASNLLIADNLILTAGNLNIDGSSAVRSLTISAGITSNGNSVSINGGSADLVLNGTGAFGTFPFPAGGQSFRNFTLNRTASGSVTFTKSVTLSGASTITNGTLFLQAATSIHDVSLASGTIDFNGQSLTITGNFTTTGGVLSGGAGSSLILSGPSSLTSALAFSPSGNTLANFTVNMTNVGVSAIVNSTLNVTSALNLTDGQLSNVGGSLVLSSGVLITRNSNGSIVTTSPGGGPWDVTYTGSSMTTGLELPASGNVRNVTVSINNGATVTLGQNASVSNNFTNAISGTGFSCSNFNFSVANLSSSGTFTAPGASATTGLTLSSSFTNNGTFNDNGGTVVIGGTVTMGGSNILNTNFNNITINGGGTLIAPATLNLIGNLVNNGTLTAGTGTVAFVGTVGSKTVSGTSNTQFYDLLLNKSNAGLSLSATTPQTITHGLTISSGQFSGANFTMTAGSTISRNSAGSVITASPSGGPWNLVYTGSSLSTGFEIPASGNVQSLTLSTNNGSTVTLTQSIIIAGGYLNTLANRFFVCGNNSLTATSFNNSGTFTAPGASASPGMVLSSNFVNDGTFNHNSGTLIISGACTMSGLGIAATNFNNITINNAGNLTPPASLSLLGNFSNNGAFNAGTGVLNFIGSVGGNTISGSSNTQFYDLTLNKSNAGVSLTTSSAQTVTHNLTLTSGQLSITGGNLSLSNGATIIRSSPGSIVTTRPSGGPWNLIYQGNFMTTGLEIPVSGIALSMTLNMNSGHTVTLGQSVSITNAITVNTGILTCGANTASAGSLSNLSTINAPSTTLTLSGNFINNATFNSGTGTVVFGGSTILSGTTMDATNFNNITINPASSLTPSNLLNILGNFTNNGTLNAGTGTVVFLGSVGGKVVAGTSNTQFNNVTLNKSNAGISLSLSSVHTINGLLTLTAGRLDNPSGRLTMANGSTISRADLASLTNTSPSGGPWNLIYTGGTLITSLEIPTSGSLLTLTQNSNSASTVTLNSNVAITNALTVNPQSTGPTFTAGTRTISAGSLLNGGIFNAPSTTLTLSGDITNNGTFGAGSGTVVFSGTSSVLGSSTTTFNHITITGTLNSPANLLLTGDFTNNGSFAAGAGNVQFNGTVTQSIQGATVTNFNDITINNTTANPGARVQSNQNIKGALNLASGAQFDADGSANTAIFTMISTSDRPVQDARIGQLLGGAAVTGNVTTQRYFSIRDNDDRFFSSPVSGASVAQIQDNLAVTGNFTGTSYPCTGCLNNGTNLRYYYEPTPGTFQQSYKQTPVNNGTNAELLVPGRGYDVYMWNGVVPIVLDLRGPINSGSLTYTVSYTNNGVANADGWNLLGNPYPSAIQWSSNASAWNSTLIDPTVYVWDYASNAFKTYNYQTSVGNLTNGIIALGQAYWVYAYPGGAALTINEQAKVGNTGTNSYYRIKSDPSQRQIVKVALTDNSTTDESYIVFGQAGTVEYDKGIDAWKLETGIEHLIVAPSDDKGRRFAHDELPSNHEADIHLYYAAREPGSYFIQLTEESPGSLNGWYLRDEVENVTAAVGGTVTSYAFRVSNDELTSDERFVLTKHPSEGTKESERLVAYPNPATGKFQFEVNVPIEQITFMDYMGKSAAAIMMSKDGNKVNGIVDVSACAPGLYILKVNTGHSILTEKVIVK